MTRAWMLRVCLIAILAIVFTGCSKDKEVTESKTTTPTKTSSPTPAAVDSKGSGTDGTDGSGTDEGKGDGAASKYDPPITLTTVRVKAPTIKYTNGDTVDNNPWTRAYEKEFGIKIKAVWEVDPTQLEQKMNLTIASGDIPDFFMVNAEQFKQLTDADLIMDLTDAYNNNASDRVKGILTEGGELPLKSATVDGKLMAIPFTIGTQEGSSMVWLRSDWLQKLNLPEPKSLQDLLAISEAFTTKDPDGNNKKDTFGLAFDKDFSTLNGFLNGYHAYRGIWLKDASGQLVYSSVQPEMKAALQKLQEMFKAGQIDREFGSKAFAKVGEDMINNKIGILYASPYVGLYPLQTVVDKNAEAEWKAYPLPSIDGTPAVNQVNLGVNGYWVVKKGVKNPEALLKMLDLWVRTFYENKDPAINEALVNAADGSEIWQMNAMAAYRAFKNVDQSKKVVQALKDGNTSELTGDDMGVYEKIKKFNEGDRTLWGWDVIFGEGGSMSISGYYKDNNLYINNEFYGAALQATVDKGPTLSKMETEAFTKIIMGASIDEFDKFVENWKKLGGDEITKQVNDWAAGK
ncbi:extracellular solute-binding protein [Paenibacillus eucommiae]|uniref:Aldouronate transport system substrate-binding protein n=1 Tax=Paenibacillus eucommiae TaxID=1355755 RepID=A0ABS4IMG7_9BACL|nr:extracellular solute-binding protein [Paenibacillus eucommiae]MBP1988764.1 putative aldouronate transport system substrate-binding protein [Paenibacillus eucommiae]